ncbi:MFS transporter [Paraburkholderia gardini]|uniref:MFS-type transporter n=1 Tax=Paraburkholderia gardini TaxID=2823469 RepID=A0ABN7QPR0_9BURK|nr:MFS transporter [Paraburkholderia gardini]CAG4901397.1 putative MFS-type transporter [Paraburkholderia gardini]
MSGHLSPGISGARGRGHRWKVLGVGFAANASFSAAFSGIPTTAVFIRSGYHVDNHALGLLFGMLGLGIAVSELPWGVLTDRWGDRRVLLLGLGLTAAALAAMAGFVSPKGAYVPGVPMLAAGLLLVGLLGGSVNGSSGRAVMAWFREGERGLAMSIRQTAVPAGGGVGALVLPALAAWHGFACVYGVLAVLCAVTAGFAWRWLHEPPAVEGVARATREDARTAPQTSPLRDVRIWRTALGMGVLCVPQLTVVTFATVFLHDFGRAGLLTISVTMAAVQTGAAIMRVWSGHWTDRRGNRRAYMRACSLVTALLFAPLAVLTAGVGASHAAMATVFAATIVLGGVSASAWHGVAFTELATLAGTRRAGTALAIGNTCVFMMMFVTPLAIPLVLSIGSWPLVWAMGSLCALAALPVFPRAAVSRGVKPTPA